MRAFTGTEFNARDDKHIMGLIIRLDHPADLVMIRNCNPNPKVFCTGEERGNADCSIGVVCMNMHIHRGISLLPDFLEKRGIIAYSMMVRADHTDPNGVD